jgi:hypothetical protein
MYKWKLIQQWWWCQKNLDLKFLELEKLWKIEQ